MSEPRTFFEKVWDDHVAAHLGGSTDLLQIDRLVLHKLSRSQAVRAITEAGRQPMSREQVFTVIEHLISARPGRGPSESASKSGQVMIDTTRKASGLRLSLHPPGTRHGFATRWMTLGGAPAAGCGHLAPASEAACERPYP